VHPDLEGMVSSPKNRVPSLRRWTLFLPSNLRHAHLGIFGQYSYVLLTMLVIHRSDYHQAALSTWLTGCANWDGLAMKIGLLRTVMCGGCVASALFMATGCSNKPAPTSVPTQVAPKMKMTTDIPPEITTPDSVETAIGTLKFIDGFPDDKTTQLVYDNLDFQRGVQAFLRGIPGASIQAFVPAAKKFGGVDGNVMIFEDLMDSKALWLTPNNSSVYFIT
jgi:hypothetical protein